jgi:hypothetical protein
MNEMSDISLINKLRKLSEEIDTNSTEGIHLHGPYWPEYAISTVGPVVGELQLKGNYAVDDKIKFMILDADGDKCYTVCLEGKVARSSIGVSAADGLNPPIGNVLVDWLTDYWGDAVDQAKLRHLAKFIEQIAIEMLREN